MPNETTQEKENKNKLNLALDYRLIIALLMAVIAIMLAMWKPWVAASKSDDRTIAVTGEAKITAEPDEYVFYPNYEFRGADKTAALSELTKKSDEVVAKLKELGVKESEIKTSSDGYGNRPYHPDSNKDETSYNLMLTIKVGNRAAAQKIQDYLVTTNPTGSVSPQATFSDNKRKELEKEARDKATREARAKADQSAKNLGFKVGSVKSVEDGSGFGAYPASERGNTAKPMHAIDTALPQLGVQPGENDLNYSVRVVYYLR